MLQQTLVCYPQRETWVSSPRTVTVVEIRKARHEDWEQIWPFFRDIVADGETYAYPDDLTAERAKALWSTGPGGTTVVAVDGDSVLGAATIGPNRPGRGSHVATASFMVSQPLAVAGSDGG